MKDKDTSQLTSIFSGTRMEAEVLKGMLAANGILSMIKDETLSAVISPYTFAGGEVKLFVAPQDEPIARALLKPEDGDKLPDIPGQDPTRADPTAENR